MRHPMLLMLGLQLAACGESTTSVTAGACIAAVNVDGVTFTSGMELSVAPADVGAVHLEVTVYTGCQDTPGATWETTPWVSGVSNFLPVGTPIHRVEAFSPSERLAYWSDVIHEWLPLEPLATP